jgi:hypothetical protein
MVCPKCEKGKVCKVKFFRTGRIAYMCDMCGSYWTSGEHISLVTGRNMQDGADVIAANEYEFVDEEDKEAAESEDALEREMYEVS